MRRWLADLAAGVVPGTDPRAVLAGLAAALFARAGVNPSGPAVALLDGPRAPLPRPLPPASSPGDPWLLGQAHEALLGRGVRRRHGVFYTPAPVARGLVCAAVGTGSVGRVCDPAVGGGAFVLAAAERAADDGAEPGAIIGERTYGIDLDPLAVDVAEAALVLWAAARGAPRARPSLVVADTLRTGLDAWSPTPAPFDLVVGNPPFQGQLAVDTARDEDDRAALRRHLGAVAHGYADTASLFLVAACRLTRPGGRVALIVPESTLAARDAGPVRAEVRSTAALVGLWHAAEPVFAAGVRVCAPILEVGGRQGGLARWTGAGVSPAPGLDAHEVALGVGSGGTGCSWAPLLADLTGIPSVDLARDRSLADLATATAGFRDQFYGVRPFVGEATSIVGRRAPLVTSGAIDPLRLRWGVGPTRFAGDSWTAPVVDLDALAEGDPRVARWADGLSCPKVLVATQTRVLEPALDEEGTAYPSVPVIAVRPRHDAPDAARATLAHIAAVLVAPPVSAWAAREAGGAARSAGAIKVSARLLLRVPLPARRDLWDEAAVAVVQATTASGAGDATAWADHLDRAAARMTEAYESGVEVLDWWRGRRPRWR